VARSLLSRYAQASPLARRVRRIYHERLTSRGRHVFWLCAVLAGLGLDTRASRVYVLFALVAGPLGVAALLALRRPPRASLRVALPARLTAGRSVTVRASVRLEPGRGAGPLLLSWGRRDATSEGLRLEPAEAIVQPVAGEAHADLGVRAERRGRYVLPDVGVARTDPLGLLGSRRLSQRGQAVLAYPRFFTLHDLPVLPMGRRYQPGGIPLASSLGDSTEFVGTRDYRAGDPLRRVHWRSWARRGRPVVKEYQEEYFARLALVLDTYLPARPREAQRRGFEAGLSVLASIADHFSRTEQLVDILAAGPDVYEVSTGRSLGYLDNVLDVLACLEPCHQPPFAVLAPRLAEKLARLTTVVAVVLDWDEAREAFLRRVRSLGVAVQAFVVHEGPTTRDWRAAGPVLGSIRLLTPDDVERRVAAETEAAQA
jgi:uncharacterized protein (DUF58 family)